MLESVILGPDARSTPDVPTFRIFPLASSLPLFYTFLNTVQHLYAITAADSQTLLHPSALTAMISPLFFALWIDCAPSENHTNPEI